MTWRNKYTPWLVVTVALLVVAWTLRDHLDHHEGTAAWVQAIGSIGAIIAAALIAGANFAEEREHARMAERQLKDSVYVLSRYCLDRVDYIIHNVRDGPTNRDDFIRYYTPSDFDGPLEGLATIPLYRLGDAALVTAVINLRREMGRIKDRLDAFKVNLEDQLKPQVFDVQDIRNRRNLAFNALASVMRIIAPGTETEAEISHLASPIKGPLS